MPPIKRTTANYNNVRQRREQENLDRISNGRHHYQLGAEIGRGGFAVVFQAFNVETGDFVAVKRFPLHAIDDESLGSIQSEIELMRKLNHPNIVKYIDTIRTDANLHIVLEYMENGSLANVIKKFGAFSESLTAIYITQVLRGLNYLHEQGVLHRDIKGANILTTKDGQVKLADFGVAMKISDVHSNDTDVVGTPYWMAPEIIAMSTPTVACDIWSVGCTIIELLTGKPPYFDLAPMAAMFRIVQDDYPPLPEGISQALRDFLLLCFQKEPILRSSASKFLLHPWLQNPSSHLTRTSELVTSTSSSDISSLGVVEVEPNSIKSIVNTIRMFQKDVEAASASVNIQQKESITNAESKDNDQWTVLLSTTRSNDDMMRGDHFDSAHRYDNSMISQDSFEEKERPSRPMAGAGAGAGSSAGLVIHMAAGAGGSDEDNMDDEDWGDDDDDNDDDNMATIKIVVDKNRARDIVLDDSPSMLFNNSINNRINNQQLIHRDTNDMGLPLPLAPAVSVSVPTVSATAPPRPVRRGKETSMPVISQDRNRDMSMDMETSHHLKSQDNISNNNINVIQATKSNMTTSLNTNTNNTNTAAIAAVVPAAVVNTTDSNTPPVEKKVLTTHGSFLLLPLSNTNTNAVVNTTSTKESNTSAANLLRFQEEENMDFSNALGDLDELDLPSAHTQQGTGTATSMKRLTIAKLRNRMTASVANVDDTSFDEVLQHQFDDTSFVLHEGKDVHIRRAKKILSIMEQIKPDSNEQEVVELCEDLLDLFTRFPEQKEHVITYYGVLPIIDMLESRSNSGLKSSPTSFSTSKHRNDMPMLSASIRPHVLRVINKIVEDNVRAQEQLSLLGLIPIIIRILERVPGPSRISLVESCSSSSSSSYQSLVDPLAFEAARFVHQISSISSLALQMLIGAGGLPTVVQMISFSAHMQIPQPPVSPSDSCNSNSNSNSISHPIAQMSSLALSYTPKPPSLVLKMTGADASTSSSPWVTPLSTDDQTAQMVYMGIDSALQVFTVQSSRTRDFCRLFVKLGLLSHLSLAFKKIMGLHHRLMVGCCCKHDSPVSPDGDCLDTLSVSSSMSDFEDIADTFESKYALRIGNILLHFSRSDAVVVESMAKEGVFRAMTEALQAEDITEVHDRTETGHTRCLSATYVQVIEVLLKCIKNLSMEPSALQALEDAGTIPTLIKLLSGPIRSRCKNHVLPSMFNLCRVNRRRQEQAAIHGLIPHLQKLILENSHLRQFALPIICDLAHNSAVCRAELWKHNGVVFYLNLLNEKYWQTFALNSLATWLSNDRERVEEVLINADNLCLLVDFFRSVSSQELSMIHKPLLDLMSTSRLLCKALSCSGLFVSSLVKRLQDADTIVLRSLLKMIQLLHQYHPCPRQLVLDYGLYGIVREFRLEEKQVLVYQIATRLLKEFQNSTLS